MLLSIPTPKTHQPRKDGRCLLPLVIPLNLPTKIDLKKDKFLTFKLHTNPNQDNASTYDLAVPFFSQGSVEELFICNKNVLHVCQGQNITDGSGQYTLVHCLLQGDVLMAFNCMALACGNKTLPSYHATMQDLVMHVLL